METKSGIKVLLGLILAILIFHFSVLLKIIPYEFAWGGRLQNDSEMYVFELGSIFVNLILGAVLLMKGNFIRPFLSEKVLNITLWVFLILFALNTVGNLFAKTTVEKTLSVLTFAFAFIIWRILHPRSPKSSIPK
mgnify:CR=1 FL=1